MIMVIMIITRVGMNKGQQDEFTGLALYFGKNLSYVGKWVDNIIKIIENMMVTDRACGVIIIWSKSSPSSFIFRDMVFLLGFFVKQIVVRWWTTWEAVPMPGHGDDYVHDEGHGNP